MLRGTCALQRSLLEVSVFHSPDGQKVEFIETPDVLTTNIAFGGTGLETAFITLSSTGQLIKDGLVNVRLAAEFFLLVREGILDRFDSVGITISFPQRSSHLIDDSR